MEYGFKKNKRGGEFFYFHFVLFFQTLKGYLSQKIYYILKYGLLKLYIKSIFIGHIYGFFYKYLNSVPEYIFAI